MQVIAVVSVLAIVLTMYVLVGFALTLVSMSVWEGEWVTTSRRTLAAVFFPFAYFVDGKVEPTLSYPVFGRYAKSAYILVSTLTWPRIGMTICLALFLGFCRMYVRLLGAGSVAPDEEGED